MLPEKKKHHGIIYRTYDNFITGSVHDATMQQPLARANHNPRPLNTVGANLLNSIGRPNPCYNQLT